MMDKEHCRRASDLGWRKFITVELMIAVFAGTFVAGGVWISLKSDVVNAHSKINAHAIAIIDITEDVESVTTDIMLIARDVSHNKESSDEIKTDLKEQRKDIKEILRIVGHD